MRKVYIPSYNRATIASTPRKVGNTVLCIHESQYDDYRAIFGDEQEYLRIPDDLKGTNMAKIRNFILDHSEGDEIVMMDDDIEYIGFFEDSDVNRFDSDAISVLIDKGFDHARSIGTVLWGINIVNSRKAYREYSPFSLSSIILGPFMGIIKSGIRFDERLGLKEDYDFSLQVLKKYRKIWRFNKYHYFCGHIDMKGGCSVYRTTEKEEANMSMFVKKWGDRIVKVKKNDINPEVIVPIRGI